MMTISAAEIKRRGISAVDLELASGPVHVIQHNKPRYVVMTEDQYRELQEAQVEAIVARVREAQADLSAGRFQRMTAQDLIDDLEIDE